MKTTTDIIRAAAKLALVLACQFLAWAPADADALDAGEAFRIETTARELLGEESAARYENILDPDLAISWEVRFPKNETTHRPGVFVYISPTDSGAIEPRWRSVMDEMNLVYIAANDSGNRVRTNRRMVLTIFALRVLERHVPFDPAKIHVAGFSGGGRVASLVASQYPEAFTAALYICGVNFWKAHQTPRVERVIRNRFVFLTGTRDFNLDETRRVYRRYLEAGAANSELMVIPGMSHELPDAASLTRALRYLAGDAPD